MYLHSLSTGDIKDRLRDPQSVEILLGRALEGEIAEWQASQRLRSVCISELELATLQELRAELGIEHAHRNTLI